MSQLRRHLLGTAGVVFLVGALLLAAFGETGDTKMFAIGLLTRSGILLIVLWFALPSVVGLYRHFPRWVWVISGLALVAAVIRGQLLVIVGVVFAVLVFFQIVGAILRPARSSSEKPSKRA